MLIKRKLLPVRGQSNSCTHDFCNSQYSPVEVNKRTVHDYAVNVTYMFLTQFKSKLELKEILLNS